MTKPDAAHVATRERIGTMEESRLNWHLDNWTAYLYRSDIKAELDFSQCQTWANAKNHTSQTLEEMLVPVDQRCAEAVDGVVESLPFPARNAVHHVHIAAVYRFTERIDPMQAYDWARGAIARGLLKRGIP